MVPLGMASAEGTAPRGRARRPSSSSLLERERELEAIDAALLAAREGEGRLLFVEAHAGLGKSRLLASAAERAAVRGFEVLDSQGSELEREHAFGVARREHAFGVARQLLESPVAGACATERDDLLDGAAAPARAVLEGSATAARTSAADQLFAVLHGLYWLTSNLAERRPLLLLVDDAHWTDRSSLRFVLYLAQRLRDLPVAVIASARVSEPGAPADLLLQMRAHPVAEVLRLAGLSGEGVTELVGDRMAAPHPELVRACTTATAGNPYLLNELLADLVSRDVEPTAASAAEVGHLAPDSVLQAALVRLGRLPPAAPLLARAVAVLGDDAAMAHAATLAGLSIETTAGAVDALSGAEIFRPGDPLAFVHALLRSAIYADVPTAQRGEQHRRAARLLDDAGAEPETVAAHLLRATHAADPWCVQRLREAATRSLAQGDPDSAGRYLARALEEPPRLDACAEVLVQLGKAEALEGRKEAAGRLDQALELLSDPHRRAKILGDLGWTLQKAGDLRGAMQAFERGLAELEGLPADELATNLPGPRSWSPRTPNGHIDGSMRSWTGPAML